MKTFTKFLTAFVAIILIISSHNANAQLSGSYTIGPSGNYTSFGAAVTALGSGVSGPVVFNVASGTYTEQITIGTITGVSATSTITFKSASGDSSTVVITGSGAYILQLNGADYITIKGMTIQTTATSSTKAVELLGGADYNTITNCVIDVPVTTTSSAYGIYNSSGLDEYNTISNNVIKNSYYGIYWYGSGTTSMEKANQILDNVLTGQYYRPMHVYYQDSILIDGNLCDLSGTAYSSPYLFYGYYLNNGSIITNNKFVRSDGFYYGLYLSSCDGNSTNYNLVANNFVAGYHSSGTAYYGIYATSCDYVNFYNNSISLTGSAASTSSRCFYLSSGTNLNLYNNICLNTLGGYGIYTSSTTNITASDYNNIYSNGNAGYWSSNQITLNDWQTASAMDANSLSVDPGFISATDLHATAVSLDGAATPIAGITTDIDGDLRDATTPDIGADEYVLMNRDAGVYSLDAPIAPCPGNNNVIVTVKNYGVQSLTSVNVNWEVNGVLQTPVSYTTTIAVAGDASVTLGSYNFLTGVNYIIKAWTSNPNTLSDQDNSNDTLLSGTIITAMSGTFTIGGISPDYTTFAAAISDLNSIGVCGPVVFNIANGTYTENVSIGSIVGVNSTNTITFQSVSGDSSTVILQYAGTATADNFVVFLDGANFITFKNITIKNTTASTYGRVVVFGNGASNNAFLNNIIESVVSTSTNTACFYSGTTIDEYNSIANNVIKNGYYGIYFDGSSSAIELNNYVANNNISDYYYYGIYMKYQNSLNIYNNSISNTPTTTNYLIRTDYSKYSNIEQNNLNISGSASSLYGIYVYYCDTNMIVSNNNISLQNTSTLYGIDLYYTDNGAIVNNNNLILNSTSTIYGLYSYYADGSAAYPIQIYNNMVAINGSTTNSIYGVYPYNCNYVYHYFNSVNVEGGSLTAGRAFYINSSSTGAYGNIVMKNNIGVNNGGGYVVEFSATANTLGYVVGCDYNDWYAPVTSATLCRFGTTNCSDISTWKTTSSLDANSLSTDPGFLSTIDLHATGIWLDGAATPIAGITTDIDGDARDATTPDIGADEYFLMQRDAGVLSLDAPIAPCPGSNNVAVIVKNFGVQSLTSVNVNWEVNGILQTPVAYTTTIAVAGDASVSLGNYNFLANASYIIKAWTSNPNAQVDQDNSNDTMTSTAFTTAVTAGTYYIGGTSPDYINFSAAVSDLSAKGVCGAVTFKVADGTYTETVSIPEILGSSATNTITFESTSGDSTAVVLTGSGTYILQLNGTDYVTIKGITIQSTSTSSTKAVEILGGANYVTISNCVIDVTVSTTSSLYGIYNTSGPDNFNTYSNNKISGGYYSMYIYGTSSTIWEKGTVIQNNEIVNSYYYPINAYYQDSIQIVGNYIHDGNAPYSYGISAYYINNAYRIIGNNVVIVGTSATACYGIRDAYGNYNTYNASPSGYGLVANNFISISGGTGINYGLYAYDANGTEYYYNTINITGGSATSRALHQYNVSTNTLGQTFKNNIFVNTGGGYSAYYSTIAQVTASDYNNFYTPATPLAYWGGDLADLTALQTASSMDANSLNVDPNFSSPTNLHTTAFALDGAGTPIAGITTDIDGDTRDASNPDIGADEFFLVADDAGVYSIDSPLPPCPGINNVEVTVMNFGTNAISTLNVNWEVNGVIQTPFVYNTSIPISGSASITVGSFNFLSGGTYIIKAWTSNPNGLADNENSNDTMQSGTMFTAMSGIYTIGGTTPDFSTFTDAVIALITKSVCGPVTFNVANGTYSETGSIPEINGASASNTITFQSASGDSSAVIITGSGAYILQLNGTDYVTIKGITIQSTSTSSTKAIEILGGANYNSITNCFIDVPTTSTSSVYGIYNATSLDNYNTYSNNLISGGYYGMYIYGASSSSWEKGNVITGNEIINSYYYPMSVYYQDSVQIVDNYIHDGFSPYSYGIYAYYINNGYKITGNRVFITGTSSSGCYGIRDGYGNYVSYNATPSAYGLVANNFISISGGTGTNYGLYAYYANGTKYYNNSINITGGSTSARALYQANTSTNLLGQTFKNNICVNTGGGLAAYFSTTAQVASTDYNNYYATGSYLAYWGGNRADLLALQTANSMDANSVSINPEYSSDIDLHAFSMAMENLGTPLAEVTTDIDGEARHATTPDMGADEYTLPANDIGIIEILSPVKSICLPSSDSIVVVIKNFGTNTQSNVSVGVKYTDPSGTTIYSTSLASIAAGGKDTITVTNLTSFSFGAYSIKAYTSLSGDMNANNDTTVSVFTFDSPQTTPFTENFNTWPPANWSFDGSRNWAQDASSNSAYANLWSWSNGNAEMYTPLVSLSGLSNAQLKFDRSYYYNTSYDDTLRISIKTCGGNWVAIYDKHGQELSTNDGAGNTSAGSFEATNVNIPQSFIGQNILVKFDGISDYGPNLYIDNVLIGEAPIVNLGNDTCVCSTHDIILDAGAGSGYTYSWFTTASSNVIATTQTITVDSAATYFVKVLDANGLFTFDTINICINPLPIVSFSGLNSDYCINAASVTLTGSPTGGSFSGTAVSAGTFSPSIALAGTHSVKYIYTNANGCTDSTSQSVIVNPLPVLTIGTLADKCFNSPAFALNFASPIGGTYSGVGVNVSGNFIAANAGAGTHYVKYTYTDGNGCTSLDSTTQTVNALPVLTTSATPDTAYFGTPTTLNVSATGGSSYSYSWTPVDSLSGVGQATLQSPTTKNLYNLTTFTVVVTDNTTSCTKSKQQIVPIKGGPLSASPTATPDTICPGVLVQLDAQAYGGSESYTYTWISSPSGFSANTATPTTSPNTTTMYYVTVDDGFNTYIDSVEVYVRSLPNPSFTGLANNYCIDAPSTTLTGIPTGGTFSGLGITANSFNPATAGVGSKIVTYTYTDTYGCTNLTTASSTINALPVVSFTGLLANYCVDASAATLVGNPSGGTFSGLGISGNSFDPSNAGIGSKIVTYTYTDANGCSNFTTASSTINALPIVSFSGLMSDYCIDATASTLAGTPIGGTFSGTGITGNSFNPATAGSGVHQIIYTYTDGNACVNSDTNTTIVNTLPIVSFTGLMTDYCVDGMADTLVPVLPTATLTYCSSNCAIPAAYCVSGNSSSVDEYINNVSINGQSNPSIGTLYTDYTSTLLTTLIIGQSYSMGVTVNAGGYTEYVSVYIDWNRNGTFETTEETSFGSNYVSGNFVFTQNIIVPSTAVLGNTLMRVVNRYNAAAISCGTYSYGETEDYRIEIVSTSLGTGIFSGMGITGDVFNPATAGVGTHSIIYTYTDANSCINSDTNTTVVHALPTPTFTGLAAAYCVDAPAVTLTGSPTGGTFSGSGVSGNTFNPAIAGVGSKIVTYTYTDANGCTNFTTATSTIYALPTPSFTGLAASYCVNASAVTLTGSPSGGTFSGSGISGNTFNPATAGLGSKIITYTYTNANACTNFTTATTTIYALPTPSFTGLAASYCANASAVTLTGSPSGGTFSGSGITGNTFNPATAGVGTKIVTYTYTNANGCTNFTTATSTIYAIPTPSFTGLAASYCANASAVTLTGSPTGGTFSGSGISGNTFNPATAGVGTKIVTYTYTNANGCTNFATATSTIYAIPTPSFTGLAASYCVNAPAVTLTGSPSGGTFSGTGITGNTFDPATAGVGTKIVTYTYTNANGCTNFTTASSTINALPVVSFTGLAANYCLDASAATLTGSPTGGTFSGTGITGNTFNPATAGVGTHQIIYAYTDANLCIGYDTQSTAVVNPPQINLGPDTTVCEGAIVVLDAGAGYTYSWSTGGTTQTISVDSSMLAVGDSIVSITVLITDSLGCTDSDTIDILFTDCSGINEIVDAVGINLYPNPSKGKFNIDITGFDKNSINMCIYNLTGQLMYCEELININSSKFTREVDLGTYPKGVYFIRLTTKDIVLTEKILIQ
ncbi:MAG: right-handed parallel beta-helix repeat-containing protein [Saprospiraceae bacterium]|nr:right-handed parallel beta-helix repeat-containing protein [Saprospiraceae bacterium]